MPKMKSIMTVNIEGNLKKSNLSELMLKPNFSNVLRQLIIIFVQILLKQKLENERDIKAQLQSEMNQMKERLQYLEQRNIYLEGEIKQQNSASKRITFCAGISGIQDASSIGYILSPDGNNRGDRSISPTRNLFNTNLNKLINDQKSPKQIPIYEPQNNNNYMAPNNLQQLIHVNQKNLSISNHTGDNSLEEDDNSKQHINIQVLKQPLNNLRFSSENFKMLSTMETKRTIASIDTRDQFRADITDSISTGQHTQRSRQNTINLKRGESHQHNGLSIDYRDNDPQLYNILDQPQEKRERRNKNVALRKFKSGDQQFFEVMNNNNNDTQSSQQNIDFSKQDYNQTIMQGENDFYNAQVNEDNIKKILRSNRQFNLGFSRLHIRTFNEGQGMQAIKLKYDSIRVAQQNYRSQTKHQANKRKQERETAKSMQFDEQAKAGQLHQIQPSQMLRKEGFDQRYQNLQINSSNDYDQYIDDDVILESEDARDCQEGNKTPYNNFGEPNRRPQVMFQNHEIMMYHSPKQHRGWSKENDQYRPCLEEDDFIQQTTRIMEDQTFTQQHLLLATPSHKYDQLNIIDKQHEIYRAAEYSDQQRKQMEKSIINRSTVKKINRKHKFTESFRNNENQEQHKKDDSDDEQEGLSTPYESKDKSLTMGENKLIKNPTYARITHASKQMEFLGQFRAGGPTIGHRNDSTFGGNPLLKSMPDFYAIKQNDRNSNTLPFDEVSGLQNSALQHSSTFLDMNTSNSFVNQPHNNMRKIPNFSSPIQNNKTTSKLLTHKSRFESPGIIKSVNTQRLFEEFFIIGVEYSDIKKLDWNKCPTQFVSPKTLFMYSDQSKDECERRRVVKDFCFPDGIEVKQVKNKGENLTDKNKVIFSKILYQTKNLREQCFIFTMNANEDGQSDTSLTKSRNQYNEYQETFPEAGYTEKFYNCLCVVFNELISDQNIPATQMTDQSIERKFLDSKIYSAKKAYCFMFSNHYYQLHLETINLLTNVLKDNYIELSNQILSNDLLRNFKNQSEKIIRLQLLRDIFSNIQQKLIIEDMYTILDKCYNLDFEMVNDQITLEFSSQIGQLKYDLPNITEIPYLENNWFCPQLFQLFPLQQFIKLLQAIMLEKSVIFVGKANLISTAILGFNCLLHPFKWCFAFVPILPHPLIDMIEAPVPLLVGITKKEYRDLNLTEQEKKTKIWVYVETGEIIWNDDEVIRPGFYFDDLQGKIEKDYKNFVRQHDPKSTSNLYTLAKDSTDYSQTLESARSSFVSDIALVFNDKQKEKCKNIAMQIRYSIKKFILGSLQDFRKNRLSLKFDNLVKQMGDIVIKSSNSQDRAFIQQFVQTQMFTTYIEDLM